MKSRTSNLSGWACVVIFMLAAATGCDQIQLTLPPTGTSTNTPTPTDTPTITPTPTIDITQTREAAEYRATVRAFQTESARENEAERNATPKPPETPTTTPTPSPTPVKPPDLAKIEISNLNSLEQIQVFEHGAIRASGLQEKENLVRLEGEEEVVIYDLEFIREKARFASPDKVAVSISVNGEWVVSGGLSREILLQNLVDGTSEVISAQPNAITALAISPDNRWVASLNINGRLIITDIKNGEIVVSYFIPFYAGNAALGDSMGFSPSGRRLAAYSEKGRQLMIWEVEALLAGDSEPAQVTIAKNPFKDPSVRFGPDWDVLVWGSENTLNFYDVASRETRTPVEHDAPFFDIVFLEGGNAVLAGTQNLINDHFFGAIHQYNLETLEREKDLAFKVQMSVFQVSPDEKWVAAGYLDGSLRLWDLNSEIIFYEMKGHSAAINALAFTPDERILASASEDGTLRFWGVISGGQLAVTPAGSEPQLFFSPDQKLLVLITASAKVIFLGIRN